MNEEVDGVPLHGFIDRLDHFVKADGSERWIISDYKTGKLPNPRFNDDPFFAMWVYALLLRAAQGVTPDAVRLLYVNAPSKEAGDLREVVTEEKLAQTSQTMRRIWSEITISHAEDRWETKKSRLCDWCYFKERGCPGHGGNREDAPLDWMDAAFAEG